MAKANLQRNKRRTSLYCDFPDFEHRPSELGIYLQGGSFDEDVYIKTIPKVTFAGLIARTFRPHWGDEFGHSCTVSEKSVE